MHGPSPFRGDGRREGALGNALKGSKWMSRMPRRSSTSFLEMALGHAAEISAIGFLDRLWRIRDHTDRSLGSLSGERRPHGVPIVLGTAGAALVGFGW